LSVETKSSVNSKQLVQLIQAADDASHPALVFARLHTSVLKPKAFTSNAYWKVAPPSAER